MPKNCVICGKPNPKSTVKVCGYSCYREYEKTDEYKKRLENTKQRRQKRAEKKQRQESAKKRRDFYSNDRRHQLKRTVEIVNKYIRVRDEFQPCISCGAINYTMTAGHYQTAGGSPELRFNELNIHGQCWFNCNKNQSGNIINYRKGLISRYGEKIVNYLEIKHPPKKYDVQDLKTIQRWYTRKTTRILRDRKKGKITPLQLPLNTAQLIINKQRGENDA